MKVLKKSIGVLVVLMLAMCALCLHVYAAEIVAGGDCSYRWSTTSEVFWELDSDGVMTISGTGMMAENPSGWDDYRQQIKKVIIEDGVTNVGSYSFSGCSELESVELPESIRTIEDYAFEGCWSLVNVEFPDDLGSIGIGAFEGCTGLTELEIGCSVGLGENSFYGCTNLVSVDIPEAFFIGSDAFADCESLKEISIPEGIEEIENGVFFGCTGLDSVNIPASVTSIGDWAFSDCVSLEEIEIPDSVTDIGDSAFAGCTGLENVNLPDSELSLGTEVFSGCTGLTKMVLPEKLTFVTDGAFKNCTGLAEVEFVNEDSYEHSYSIGDEAFAGCISLKHIEIPKLWYIHNSAFADCTGLQSVIINSTFSTLDIVVESLAFSNCTSLQYVFFNCTEPTRIEEDAFSGVAADAYYPEGDTTWTQEGWQNYGGNLTWKEKKTLKISEQPATGYAQSGKKAAVSLDAEGNDLSYQWYIKNSGSSRYSKSSVTGAAYSCTMNSKSKDRLVYCVVTDAFGNSVKSKTVRLRMAATVTDQSRTTYTKQGSTAKATVTAVGDDLTYQWYVKNVGGTKYSKSSITKAAYSCKMSSTSKDRLVYCIVTDKYGKTARSETVRLRMAATITTQPQSVSAAEGKQAKVTLSAVGDGLTYTWYYKEAGAEKFSKTSTFTGPSYYVAMTKARDGRQVYCVVTDKYGKKAKSNIVTLRME